ncbi:hypothetical protein BDW02DRAFT_95660 [Decorospora gaudefroyi]|uniref:Uncharacterized protein n=1 Tax=Decorospora gaudefroyi TaxID=184978 RepID=A0A6A5KNJ4_9PLEO|nr:hypothetical protein BDW02DRAFT_95660 [Decorospora gaudefroyi]
MELMGSDGDEENVLGPSSTSCAVLLLSVHESVSHAGVNSALIGISDELRGAWDMVQVSGGKAGEERSKGKRLEHGSAKRFRNGSGFVLLPNHCPKNRLEQMDLLTCDRSLYSTCLDAKYFTFPTSTAPHSESPEVAGKHSVSSGKSPHCTHPFKLRIHKGQQNLTLCQPVCPIRKRYVASVY